MAAARQVDNDRDLVLAVLALERFGQATIADGLGLNPGALRREATAAAQRLVRATLDSYETRAAA